MGFLNNMMDKIGKGMEKVMSKNLSGDSKEQYEKEKEEKEKVKQENESDKLEMQNELALHKVSANKSELKELEPLLKKVDVMDDDKLWIAGFDNFKANQNAKAANLFSGNKNVKTLSKKDDDLFVCKYSDEHFYAIKKFAKDDVVNFTVEGMLGKSVKLQLKDGYKYSVDVTENKDKLTQLKEFLK